MLYKPCSPLTRLLYIVFYRHRVSASLLPSNAGVASKDFLMVYDTVKMILKGGGAFLFEKAETITLPSVRDCVLTDLQTRFSLTHSYFMHHLTWFDVSIVLQHANASVKHKSKCLL